MRSAAIAIVVFSAVVSAQRGGPAPEDFSAVKAAFPSVSAACNACHQRFGGTNAPRIRD